jgi:hypothetical protein
MEYSYNTNSRDRVPLAEGIHTLKLRFLEINRYITNFKPQISTVFVAA